MAIAGIPPEANALFERLHGACLREHNQNIADAVMALLVNLMVAEAFHSRFDQAKVLEMIEVFTTDLRNNVLENAAAAGIKPAVLSS